MDKKILLQDGNTYLRYSVKFNSRAKKLILKVKPTGDVVLTVPPRVSEKVYENFLTGNLPWITAQQSKVTKDSAPQSIQRKQYLEAKVAVARLAKQRLAHFNSHYNFTYKKITIRDQNSRWGSCSNSGTLSFNYRIIYLEDALQDYVFVHELCHLKEMNHAQSFWDLVGETIPNYKYLRRKLKRYEAELF